MLATENHSCKSGEKSVDNLMRNNALLDTVAEAWVELWAVVTVSAKEGDVTESGR